MTELEDWERMRWTNRRADSKTKKNKIKTKQTNQKLISWQQVKHTNVFSHLLRAEQTPFHSSALSSGRIWTGVDGAGVYTCPTVAWLRSRLTDSRAGHRHLTLLQRPCHSGQRIPTQTFASPPTSYWWESSLLLTFSPFIYSVASA